MFILNCKDGVFFNGEKIKTKKELYSFLISSYKEHKGKVYLKGESISYKKSVKEITDMFCLTVIDLEPQPYFNKISLLDFIAPRLNGNL